MGDKAIIELDPAKSSVEFADLVDRCYRKNPDKKDLAELRKVLEKSPELYKAVFDLSEVVTRQTIRGMLGDKDKATQTVIEAHVKNTKQEFGYERAPMAEKLLIENIVLAWLRYTYAEYQITSNMNTDATYKNNEHWEKRANAAHRRYMRAIETLTRVRKLTANIQVNIATNGGQQVNIGGDLNKQ